VRHLLPDGAVPALQVSMPRTWSPPARCAWAGRARSPPRARLRPIHGRAGYPAATAAETAPMPETIYDALRESHEIQRSLFRRLLRSRPGTRGRVDLFTQTRRELEAHEAAEERFLYAPMLMDDMGLASTRHALHEHHEIDELVEELRGLDPAGDAWIDKARELSRQVHHHLREEENKFFQVSGKVLGEAQKTALARKYRKDYQRMHRVLAEK
jgi:hypothetical protein